VAGSSRPSYCSKGILKSGNRVLVSKCFDDATTHEVYMLCRYRECPSTHTLIYMRT
jgi:hypothetical protein